MRVGCGGIFNDHFSTCLLPSPLVKEFWKWVNICQSYGNEYGVLIFYSWGRPTVNCRSKCQKNSLVNLITHFIILVWSFNSLVDRFLWQAVPDHLHSQRFFEFGDWFGFRKELVIGLQHRAPDMVVHGSSESGGHWSFLMNSGSWPEAIPVFDSCRWKRNNNVLMKFH